MIIMGSAYKNRLVNDISMQHPDKRWSGSDIQSGYVAVYLADSEALAEEDIQTYKQSYDNFLKEDSFEIPENARLYADAYSTQGRLEAAKEYGNAGVNVNVTAIGGDFFNIHTMELLYGSYICGDDIMKDGVVLDENAAWNLYGSSNIVGKYIYINNDPYYICGVVKPASGKSAKKTYGDQSRIFMHFASYKKYNENAGITCYEVLYPDVINNYAVNCVKKAMGLDENESEREIEIVNMSRRFSLSSLWKVLSSYGTRSQKTHAIRYPYWENECRRTEDFASLVLVWNALFIIIALIVVMPACVFLFRKIKSGIQIFYGYILERLSILC